jgi:hypothetical protein
VGEVRIGAEQNVLPPHTVDYDQNDVVETRLSHVASPPTGLDCPKWLQCRTADVTRWVREASGRQHGGNEMS